MNFPSVCACCSGLMLRGAFNRRRLLAAAGGGLAALAVRPRRAAADEVPLIPYDSAPNPLHLPANVYFGEVSGVALNSKGHVFALSRGNTTGPAYAAASTQLLEFGPNGRFIREIGRNLYAWSFAHTVKVDRHDNVWVTDKGSDMVIKFTPDARVDMVFGRKQEASDEGTGPLKHPNPPLPAEPGRFRQVTDVTWDSADNAYISDGYINSRVAKVDKDGNWIKSWGDRGTGPGQFNTPHSIATDAQNNIYVADRANPASRCSTPTANSCASSPSTCRCRPTRARRSATFRARHKSRPERLRRARRGRSASRPAPTRRSTVATRGRDASTSSPSTASSWACSANRANSSNNSAGSTRWPARPKTCSTSPNC